MPYSYETDRAAIDRQCFAMIRAEADLAGFDPADDQVAVRMIHAAGMVGLAAHLRFSPGFSVAARLRLAHPSCAMRAWSAKASHAPACPPQTR